ncbi:fas apoptotic inhibitory molecule 1-like, partial [Plakobranchus ocellatus]
EEMSVILTACRQSRQRAIERALKKKAEKKRAKRDAAKSALTHQLGMDNIEGENNVKIWTFLLNGEPTSVVLHRDTLEVACNGVVIESMNDFCDCGSTITFPIGERNAQITCTFGERPKDGMTFTLTVEGCLVPDVVMEDETQPFDPDCGPSTDPF